MGTALSAMLIDVDQRFDGNFAPVSARSWSIIRSSRVMEENLFNGFPKESGNRESQGKAGIKFTCLNRIDGLSRHPELIGKVGLGPVLHDAKDFDAVFHL